MKRILSSDTTKYLGKKVRVAGWVHSLRSHGKIIFVDLRDKGGLLQLVFTPKEKEVYRIAKKLDQEWVINRLAKINEL